MHIGINVGGVKKNPVSIFAGINGEKKKIKEVYVEKDGLPLLVYPKNFNINNCFYLITNNCILYSDNGTEWRELKTNGLPESLSWFTFSYRKGIYILFNETSGDYYRSTDLINWDYYESIYAQINGTTLTNGHVTYFGFVNDRFIAINNHAYYDSSKKVYNTEEFKYSLDGIVWNNISGLNGFYSKSTYYSTQSQIYSFSDFYYLNGTYVCKAFYKSSSIYYQIIYYSNNGVNWYASARYTSSIYSDSKHYGLNTIYCFNDLFIRKYYDPADKKSFLYYSSDGKTWKQSSLPSSIAGVSFSTINYINGKFIIPIYKSGIGNNIYCSKDLNNWESESMGTLPIYSNYINFISSNDILVAHTLESLSTIKSCYYDKINNSWNEFTMTEYTDTTPFIQKIEYINGLFFMIGKSKAFDTGILFIFYSLSGINYLPCNIVSDSEISIRTNNDIFYIGDMT